MVKCVIKKARNSFSKLTLEREGEFLQFFFSPKHCIIVEMSKISMGFNFILHVAVVIQEV